MVGASATATATATTTTTTNMTTHLVGTPDTQHTHVEMGIESPSTPASTPTPQTSRNFLCTSCQISFLDSAAQRTHMKEAWHVNNVKRRMEKLGPLEREEFEREMGAEKSGRKSKGKGKGKKKVVIVEMIPSLSSSGSSVEDDISDKEIDETEDKNTTDNDLNNDQDDVLSSPYTCLFCASSFPRTPTGLSQNLTHMSTAHAFALPSATHIVDTTTFIAYLATEIRAWNECLYCGAVKDCVEAVQSHMRDKAHCKLNLEREPELKEFWEGGVRPGSRSGSQSGRESEEETGSGSGSESEETREMRPRIDEDGEMRFSSGKVVASKTKSASKKKRERRAARLRAQLDAPAPESPSPTSSQTSTMDAATAASILALIPSSNSPNTPPLPLPKPKNALTLRKTDSMSITGISEQARHALVLAEKKAQRSEAMAVRAREWVRNRGANMQKYDQVDTTGKWGKQLHHLLPR